MSSDGENDAKDLRKKLLGIKGSNSESDSETNEENDNWRKDFDKSNKNKDDEIIIKFNVGF